MNEQKKLLKIGELAKQTEELVSAIRYWTSERLLKVSTHSKGGYQLYDPSMIDRVKQIRKLQNNDRLTIAEIRKELK